MPKYIVTPNERIASAVLSVLRDRALPKSQIERAATAFLKEWVLYVEAVPLSDSEEYMKGMCNAIFQIREVFTQS